MAKDPDELPLPAPPAGQPTGVRIKEVPVQPAVPRYAKVILGMLAVLVIGSVALFIQRQGDAASADRQDGQIAASVRGAARTDCALRIAAEYEGGRDEVFKSLAESPAALRAAATSFATFTLGPDGKPETRAERTDRECGSAVEAVKGH